MTSAPTQQSVGDLITAADRHQREGRPQDSIAAYRQWLAANENAPEAAAAWFNLGTHLSGTGDLAGAGNAYRNALQQRPGFWPATINLATLLESQKEIAQALALYQAALSVPQTAEATVSLSNQLGRVLESQREFARAAQLYFESLTLNPAQPDVFQHWAHVRQKQCAWPLMLTAHPTAAREIAAMIGPLAGMAYFDDPEMLQHTMRSWVERHLPKSVAPLASGGYGHERLRIGYISCDFRMHAVCFLSALIYEHHDRTRFEVFAFDNSIDDRSAWRQRIIDGVDHFIGIHHLSNEQASALIRSHEIDILVDMMGLTAGARPAIIAAKPAPVQISYLGFLGPSGIEQMDYVLADPYVLPAESAKYYLEKPLYMRRCFQVNNRLRQAGTARPRSHYGLPDNAFVFCAINNSYKLTEEMFARWMRILLQLPDSVLWLLQENEAVRENLVNEAKRHNIAASRLVFAEPILPADYLARFTCADLFLDSSPYNAGATASDALWMGLPVLTCPGKTYVSRMAGSLLTELGLPELIAPSWPAYEQAAVALARDRAATQALRHRVSEAVRTSRLFDTAGFVREMEHAFDAVATLHGLRAPSGASDSFKVRGVKSQALDVTSSHAATLPTTIATDPKSHR